MAGYCVLSIKKYHTFPQLSALQKHNTREIPLPNVDPSLSVRNVELISRGDSYTDVWHDIVNEEEITRNQKIGLRKNSVIALEILTGYAAESSFDTNVNAWADKTLDWVKETFGEKNIIASTLHLDETSPHIHTEIVPIDDKGKLNAKSYTGGRMAMMKLHTSYGKAMEPFGLKRGERASKSKKKDLVSFYKSVNKAANAALPPRLNGEEEEDYIKRMEEYCKKMKMATVKLQTELEASYARTGTLIAQEFSKYSHAVSLYEDLYEKFNGDEKQVNARITAYRKIENRTPSDALSGLINNLIDKFEDRATPLINWATKGKKALKKIEDINSQDDSTKTDSSSNNMFSNYVSLDEAEEMYGNANDEWIYDEDTNDNDMLDI